MTCHRKQELSIDDLFIFRCEKTFLGQRDLMQAYKRGLPVIVWVKDGYSPKSEKLQKEIRKYDKDGWIQMWQNPNVSNLEEFKKWYILHIGDIANEPFKLPEGHDSTEIKSKINKFKKEVEELEID